MQIRLKKEINAWAQGEVVYVKGETINADKRYAEELLATGHFETVPKKAEKTEEIK